MSERLNSLHEESIKINVNLKENRDRTEKLNESTNKLNQIISDNQKRGAWGEKMVIDILRFIGFKEGVHYDKQKKMTDSNNIKPDFTFYLPKGKNINMDVKFPASHYMKYIQSDDENVMKIEKKAFFSDVRKRITETSKYIDKNTVNYALMLIPNDSIYAFINQESTEMVDFALEQNVFICSPLLLYAVLSIINQSVESFTMEKNTSILVEKILLFKSEWDEYKKVEKLLEGSINSVNKHFKTLSITRKKKLEETITNIESDQIDK